MFDSCTVVFKNVKAILNLKINKSLGLFLVCREYGFISVCGPDGMFDAVVFWERLLFAV